MAVDVPECLDVRGCGFVCRVDCCGLGLVGYELEQVELYAQL